MYKLPINGRIVLVDDKIEQALPLMNYFSKNKIPFTYFDGNFENLPQTGFDDIRLLFLDINLAGDTVPTHQHFRTLQTVVDKLIDKVTHPYLLILWTRDPTILYQFKNEFFTDSTLIKKSPVDILALEKDKFFSYSGTPLDGDINELEEELIQKLNSYPELRCILHWESTVHHVTNQIASMFFPQFSQYETWSDETRKMFIQFSKASLGKYFDDADAETRINSAFEVIHQVFMDELETRFYKADKNLILENMKQLPASNFMINTRLLIQNHEHLNIDYPGSLVALNNKKASAFFANVIDQNKLKDVVSKYYESLNNKSKQFSELTEREQGKECSKYKKEKINAHLQQVRLRIDPLCDYVQKKIHHSKCVDGILIPEIAYNLIDKRSEAIYISPIFEYKGINVALIVDFRTFHTQSVANLAKAIKGLEGEEQTINTTEASQLRNDESVVFRLRSALLADIQSKFARHANRQGLLYL
ncbi:hypothetical protein [Acinetobacter courvalinii]|uniref:hypothetical protein n=1 Tax=Acinetobacter courvalinii TaxID=280147 RepID=UPI0021D0D5CC|nr:hypothetical protein [Acinetobacter courvalinii]MCU4368284.1 hypothetical protein [Acinetobacter courvalinii]MCU4446654.1 hypothetical protein [Acinetobacter courvalinii]